VTSTTKPSALALKILKFSFISGEGEWRVDSYQKKNILRKGPPQPGVCGKALSSSVLREGKGQEGHRGSRTKRPPHRSPKCRFDYQTIFGRSLSQNEKKKKKKKINNRSPEAETEGK